MVEESDKKMVVAQVLGKMLIDREFLKEFKKKPLDAVIKASENIGKKLEESEIREIESTIQNNPMPFMTVSEMKDFVEDTIKKADAGYKKVQFMSIILFLIGIGFIVTTFIMDVYGIIYQVNWQTLIAGSGVLGGIGIVTIYESTVKLPEKVKKSVADLVQIKLSFFGYLDQLYLLMQVNNSNADEAIKIMKMINTATENTTKRIQDYCEK